MPAPIPGRSDALLAAALRCAAPWPADLDEAEVLERALYHGIAGILTDHAGRIRDWPAGLRDRLRAQALSQTMWDMRHGLVLADLIARLAAAGVETVLLKGTALAHGLYPRPAQRARGDSDLLIAPADLDAARTVLADAGFVPFLPDGIDPDAGRLQEPWTQGHDDGTTHEIDLHWAVLNSPRLDPLLPVAQAFVGRVPLSALGPQARAMAHDHALLHACLHRAVHVLSPYFVDGVAHHGGDRLIWLVDIDLLWRALDSQARADLSARAIAGGVGPVLGDALAAARDLLGTPVPETELRRLTEAPLGPAGRYLTRDDQTRRALRDLSARRGLAGKLRFLRYRLFPPQGFLRAKYPDMARWPLPLLYLRRIATFWRPRPDRGVRR